MNFFSGKTFGESHNKYKNTYQAYSLGRTVKADSKVTPGPGKYNFTKQIGEDKVKKTMSAKLKISNSNDYKVPSTRYTPKHHLTEHQFLK